MSISPQTTHDPNAPGETVPILETEHLSKVFPVRRLNHFAPALGVHAAEDASLALYPGRVTALVGESGSGKTTIARLLARVYDPTAGTIRFTTRICCAADNDAPGVFSFLGVVRAALFALCARVTCLA